MTESINEYQLLEELGQGSFGTVRRASQAHACGEHSFVVCPAWLLCTMLVTKVKTRHFKLMQAIKTMSKKRLKRKVKMHREVREHVAIASSCVATSSCLVTGQSREAHQRVGQRQA